MTEEVFVNLNKFISVVNDINRSCYDPKKQGMNKNRLRMVCAKMIAILCNTLNALSINIIRYIQFSKDVIPSFLSTLSNGAWIYFSGV